MSLCKILIHQILRQLNISCKRIRQTIHKFNKFHTVATKSGADRTTKITQRQKRLIKLQHVWDDTLSLTDFVRFAPTDFNLTISRQTVSYILRDFDKLWFRILHLENVELLLHRDVHELIDVVNISAGQ